MQDGGGNWKGSWSMGNEIKDVKGFIHIIAELATRTAFKHNEMIYDN